MLQQGSSFNGLEMMRKLTECFKRI
jgi:hypothetical protein